MSAVEFDGTPLTKREVLIARAAYILRAHEASFGSRVAAVTTWGDDVQGEAERAYPLPRVTRPRIANDPISHGVEWTVQEGALRSRRVANGQRFQWRQWREFKEDSDFAPLPERVALWSDLFANPTEDVEVEE